MLVTAPWQVKSRLNNGDRIKFLIVNGGNAGIMLARRSVEAGFPSTNIRIVGIGAVLVATMRTVGQKSHKNYPTRSQQG